MADLLGTKILVTGAAGFIGMHTAVKLLKQGYTVVGLDNLNDYYDVNLKKSRLEVCEKYDHFSFLKMDISDRSEIESLFAEEKFDYVVHLAGQAGVRYSLENPHGYIDSNIVGFMNILEGCRHNKVKHLVYASSSSVYGANEKSPFNVNDPADHPLSLYAATKRSNELMAHSYSHLFNLPTTGLRFFTVYGPWGRPDMAPFLFTKAIVENKNIQVFNEGQMLRDFTYVDDITEGIVRSMKFAPDFNANEKVLTPARSTAPYRVYNIGCNRPVMLMDFISTLETIVGVTAKKTMMPMQPGDMLQTFSENKDFQDLISYIPQTTLKEGLTEFVDWYLRYYNVVPVQDEVEESLEPQAEVATLENQSSI